MRILTVIPIARGISKDTLTYFTQKDIAVGSIVSIPVRKRIIYGLVTSSQVASEIKSELKSLAYSIKKIEDIETIQFLSKGFVRAAEKIADYNAASIGATLSALIPKVILDGSGELVYTPKDQPAGIFHETVLLQSDDDERYATYRSLVREEFAKGKSVFFCLPTTEDLLNAKATLEKGIEKYTYVLHGGLSKKEILTIWQKVIDEPHTVLIIATGSFLAIPRHDLGTIILEKESSRAYKMQARPFLDIRTVAEMLAKELNVRLVLGDLFLRIETLWEEKNGKYAELSPLKFRSLTTATCEVQNMKGPEDMNKKEFVLFSERLKSLLQTSKENNEKVFMFCSRKGLYPQTVCADCGTIVVCKNCNAPVVLYGKAPTTKNGGKGNLFVCNHCGERRDAQELCKHCGGWRLNPLGIGIERVAEEVKSLLPDTEIILMDKEHIATHKQAVKARDLFYNNAGSIMIGTEMALTYLNAKIENAVVVSLDSYFSIPDFQITEKIFHILLTLRAVAEKNVLVQTRKEDTKLFDNALRGNLMDFYRDEIEERKSIDYPPFATYIKISIEGDKVAVKKEMNEILEFMKPFELRIYDAFNPGSMKKYTMHGLITLPKGKWVDLNLLSKLRALPPQCSVRIDPVTLL